MSHIGFLIFEVKKMKMVPTGGWLISYVLTL